MCEKRFDVSLRMMESFEEEGVKLLPPLHVMVDG